MNLYEITDMKTGKVIEPVITLREASEKLNCKPCLISNAYYGGHLASHRYRVRLADETVKQKRHTLGGMGRMQETAVKIMREG